MLKKIYLQRYKTALIVLFVAIVGMYSLNGYNTTNAWNNLHDDITSVEYKEGYERGRQAYLEDNPDDGFLNFDDHQKLQLTVFFSFYENYNQQSGSISNITNEHDYQIGKIYHENQSISDKYLLKFIVCFLAFTLGFALFFIDLKTNFNQFLFSLPRAKKQLFDKKMIYVALPILSSFLVGAIMYSIILQLGIPKDYLAVTFLQSIYSSFSHFILITLIFSLGVLLGSLMGNLIMGPLTVLFGFITLSVIPQVYISLRDLLEYFKSVKAPNPNSFLVTFPNKTGAYPLALVLMFSLALLFFYFTRIAYTKTSLDNNGQYLLLPAWRRRIWLILSISMTIYLSLLSLGRPYYLFEMLNQSVTKTFVSTILWTTLFSFPSMFLLIYFSDIKRAWQKRRHNKLSQ